MKASNYLQGGSVVSYMCFIVIFIKNSISMVPKPVTMETGHLEQGGERVQRGGKCGTEQLSQHHDICEYIKLAVMSRTTKINKKPEIC